LKLETIRPDSLLNHSRSSRLPNPAGLVALILALWTVLTTIAVTIAASSDMPYEDEWDIWRTIAKQGYSLTWFFSQNNDHRIVTTRLLFVLDRLAFHGQGWFPRAVSLVVQAVFVLLLWRLARRAANADPADSRVLGAAIACCLFSAQQAINFMWGFQVQFFLVYAAGAAALAALLRAADSAHPTVRRAWTAAALLLAVLGSYSMANGVLIWPLLLLAAVRLRLSRAAICVLGLGGVAVFVQYLHGWHTAPLDAPAPLWRIVLFAFAHAGSPIVTLVYALGAGPPQAGPAATLIGGLLMVYTAAQWLLIWRYRSRYSGAQVVMVHLAVYVAAASFAISVGRAHLPLIEAFRSRYITPPYILWACLLAVAWPSLRALTPNWIRWAIVAALLLGIVPYQAARLGGARGYAAELRQASVALAVGVNDPAVVEDLLRPDSDSTTVAYMKAHGLAIFHAEWTTWAGQPLTARFQIRADAASCAGAIREAVPIAGTSRPGWRVSGWARGAKQIVLADAQGAIAGVALANAGDWSGYARPGSAGITAYAVEPDGKSLCALGTTTLGPR